MKKLKGNPHPSALKIPDEKGAPENRIRNAYQVFDIAKSIDEEDEKRSKKRSRVFKQYCRFPPTAYSTLKETGKDWQSDVCFGMLSFIVDNNISTFFDMITERRRVAEIVTKHGDPKERSVYSSHISDAFDKVIREWDDFLLNQEQDLLDMHLYGKGIEIREDVEGCMYEHVSADDFKLPKGTKINLKNFDVALLLKTYTIKELWEKIEKKGKSEEDGWNRKSVLNAMWYCRDDWKKKYNSGEDLYKNIMEGNIAVSSHLKENVYTYMLFVKEFDGKLSKFIVLRDYGDIIMSQKKDAPQPSEDFDSEVIKKEGFLFKKEKYKDGIDDLIVVFMDSAGSGMWHNNPSLAEKIYVQCRQYDFTMNAIMDAVKINMSLILQASTQDSSEKLKGLEFDSATVIPADLSFIQHRFQLPTQEGTQAVQFMMLDMFRGIGEYRVSERTDRGEAVTATQNRNDTAEAARISGTQLKRYNEQHTKYYRKIFKALVSLTRGEKDYEHCEKFKTYLKDRGVPESSWKWDNIESINSNLLAGAGSPAQKMQAAEAIIGLLNISPKGEGQARAIEDGIAAAGGRSNVSRYMDKIRPDPSFNQRLAGYENLMLADPFAAPENIQVNPDDDDIYHLSVHFQDMDRTIMLLNENIDKNTLTMTMGEIGARKLLNQGGHVMAHIQKLSRDKAKDQYLKEANSHLNDIQQKSGELQKKMQSALAEQQQAQQTDPSSDPKVQLKLAEHQLQLSHSERMHELELGHTAKKHATDLEHKKEKAAVDIAVTRSKAQQNDNNGTGGK